MNKEQRIKQLIENYKKWDKEDDGYNNYFSCLARDNKRKIKKVFEKEMHEPIDNYLKED